MSGSILVVDDDPDVRDAMLELLETAGFTVRAASDGAEALRLLNEESTLPSLIFLDVEMPGMGGSEFLARRASEAQLTNIPVVLVSATERSLGGVNGFLRKPVNVDRLLGFAETFAR